MAAYHNIMAAASSIGGGGIRPAIKRHLKSEMAAMAKWQSNQRQCSA